MYMENVVMPDMAAVFREHRPGGSERMNCVTCHGQRAVADDFRMPNPDLRLTAAELAAARSSNPDPMSVFMIRWVVPEMTRLTGRALDDDRQCFACHVRAP